MMWMANYDMQNLNLYGMHHMQRKKPNVYKEEKFKTKRTRKLCVPNLAA